MLYGTLFHEAFDILRRFEPPWNEQPTTAIALVHEKTHIIEAALTCVSAMIPQSLEYVSDVERCHIFHISATSNGSVAENNFSYGRCSASNIEIPTKIDDVVDLWQSIDSASQARSGWITSNENALASSVTSLIKERIEYYRHRETWLLGRDPFQISSLAECSF